MSVFGASGIGGFLLNAAGRGEFSGGGMGLIPDSQAYGMGANTGSTAVEFAKLLPIDLPSPANLDPFVTLFGMEKGPIGLVGGFVEDTTEYHRYAGAVVGGVAGTMFLGNTELGVRAGWTAGVMGGAFIDASSDAGVGMFDLDGEETRDQKPLVTWWKA
jgi:hypothetical protein